MVGDNGGLWKHRLAPLLEWRREQAGYPSGNGINQRRAAARSGYQRRHRLGPPSNSDVDVAPPGGANMYLQRLPVKVLYCLPTGTYVGTGPKRERRVRSLAKGAVYRGQGR